MKTFSELLNEIKSNIAELNPSQVNNFLKENEKVTLLDIREKDEVAQGYIKNALKIPRGFLELKIETLLPQRDSKIIVYCAVGTRSILATKTLKELGYENVFSMSGGFNQWKNLGFEFVKEEGFNFTTQQLTRYNRQILLEEVGEVGQEKLLKAKVLLVGAGGLGSPAAYYLAAAGVGTVGLVDPDIVDLSNLHRQILHTTVRVGQAKVESAKETLKAINPEVKVITYQERLTSENAQAIISQYDLVLDGTDNFATKYLINDACYFAKKPNVYGSIFKFEGQVTVFDANNENTPCYRCLFSSPPPAGLAPNCAEAGVLGILPGVIGTLQAVEAIKIILGKGETLANRLLTYDALSASFRTLKIRKDTNCKLCGKEKSITNLIDYENFCAV